jgi:hypothetical protein
MSRRFDRELFLELLEKDDHQARCAARAGVSPEYVCRLKKRDPAFAEEIERCLARCRSTRRSAALHSQRRELSARP